MTDSGGWHRQGAGRPSCLETSLDENPRPSDGPNQTGVLSVPSAPRPFNNPPARRVCSGVHSSQPQGDRVHRRASDLATNLKAPEETMEARTSHKSLPLPAQSPLGHQRSCGWQCLTVHQPLLRPESQFASQSGASGFLQQAEDSRRGGADIRLSVSEICAKNGLPLWLAEM